MLLISEELYRGAGKCWIAVDSDDTIIAIEYMDDYAEPGLAELGRKRLTNTAMRDLRNARAAAFVAHRRAARERLGARGEVVSGIASGGRFFPV